MWSKQILVELRALAVASTLCEIIARTYQGCACRPVLLYCAFYRGSRALYDHAVPSSSRLRYCSEGAG